MKNVLVLAALLSFATAALTADCAQSCTAHNEVAASKALSAKKKKPQKIAQDGDDTSDDQASAVSNDPQPNAGKTYFPDTGDEGDGE